MKSYGMGSNLIDRLKTRFKIDVNIKSDFFF